MAHRDAAMRQRCAENGLMAHVIDYWRGLVADLREARSNAPHDLKEVGDLWYPVLRMRVLASVHDAALKRLGPVDVPAAHAEELARRVWADVLGAIHKRAVPEAWADYAAIIDRLRPWLCARLGVGAKDLRDALAAMPAQDIDALAEDAFAGLFPGAMSSRDEHVSRGAVNAFLLRDRPWPDLGTWAPFTLYSITARYFEQGSYLGRKTCTSESEIRDLVELPPFGRAWAEDVVRARAQRRTVDSYLGVLGAVLERREVPGGSATVARRLTLVEWLSDPEARLARLVQIQGLELSDAAIARSFAPGVRRAMRLLLRGSLGYVSYPPSLAPDARRRALEGLVEALEGCMVRTELLVLSSEGGGMRGLDWARSVVRARAPRSSREHHSRLLEASLTRRAPGPPVGSSGRNQTLRSLHRLLSGAASPGAGVRWEAGDAAEGAR